MLIAQLKGKLTIEEERLEDLLTSNVFGSFKYVKPEDGLLLFLKEARTLDGSRLFANLPHVCSCYYEFWPVLNYSASCEPDAIIWLTHHDGSLAVVMVESKYLSGKSSLPSQGMLLTDQLAKEWDNLKYLVTTQDV